MGKNDPIALHVFFGLDEDNECGAVLSHSICQLCEMRSLCHRFVFAISLIKAMHPIDHLHHRTFKHPRHAFRLD
jgi:hypothetical protein